MPVYVYTGEDTYHLSRAVKRLREKIVQPEMAALSYKVLQAPSIAELQASAGAVSFALGGDTLLEVREFSYMAKSADGKGEEAQLEILKEMLLELPSSKHVLFVSAKMDRKYKFPKWITGQKSFIVQEFKDLAFWQTEEAAQQLLAICREEGWPLTPQAAELLVASYGVGFQPLINEVQKLAVYTAGQPITPEAVAAISVRNDNVFEMLEDWMNDRDRSQIARTLNELLLRQHPVQLFSLLQTTLDNAYRLRLWKSLGMSDYDIAQKLNKKPFKIQKDLEKIATVPLARLQRLKHLATEMEGKMKTGRLNDRLALEVLLAS
jgi:DNA polymerase-3 subunit delta